VIDEDKGVSVQEAYNEIGGFGRFHYLIAILLILGTSSGQYIISLMSFLELEQQFECSNTADFNSTFECTPRLSAKNKTMAYFCDTNLFRRPVWDASTSLHNLYEQLDLACESKAKIGLIGSSIYIGWTTSSFILPRVADIMGRKPVVCISMLIQTIAFIGIFFTDSINLAYFFMFLFGAASVGRTSISFLYLMEVLPKAQQILVGTIL
jgi:hypothetical protein